MKESCLKGYFCSKAGFTLIELLVVVLIIGILAAVAMPQYRVAVEKSRLAEALTKVDALKKAMDLYVLEHGTQDAIFIFANPAPLDPMADLDIDVTSDLDCTDSHMLCYSKYFGYFAECNTSHGTSDRYSCTISAQRTIRDDDEYDSYGLDWEWTPNETIRKACWYEGEIAEKICNSLSSLGWEPLEN